MRDQIINYLMIRAYNGEMQAFGYCIQYYMITFVVKEKSTSETMAETSVRP